MLHASRGRLALVVFLSLLFARDASSTRRHVTRRSVVGQLQRGIDTDTLKQQNDFAARKKQLVYGCNGLRGGGSSSIRSDRSDSDRINELASGVISTMLFAVLLYAMAVGMATPSLPFFIMGLGADAVTLSACISCNSLAMIFGNIYAGWLSDKFGRKPVLVASMACTAVYYSILSAAKTIPGVAVAQIVGGLMGGIPPIAQSVVADMIPQQERPKYIGRIQACIGCGFVLGPLLMVALRRFVNLELQALFRTSSLIAGLATLVAALFIKESKDLLASTSSGKRQLSKESTIAMKLEGEIADMAAPAASVIPLPVLLLIGNSFLIAYAFAVQSVYAMFIKDNFGFGEATLAKVFAGNGLAVAVLQLFFMRHIVARLGKHVVLLVGNLCLAGGMIGLCRQRVPGRHFALFTVHLLGYAVAEVASVSLISRYSDERTQGRFLGLNMAAMAMANVISPITAGLQYKMSKRRGTLPVGALPYLIGSVCPLIGVAVPFLLYVWSVEKKEHHRWHPNNRKEHKRGIK